MNESTVSCRSPAMRRAPTTPRGVAAAAPKPPAADLLQQACIWGCVGLPDGRDPQADRPSFSGCH